MANVSMPSNFGGAYGNASGGTTTQATEAPKLATAQTPTPTTAGPNFVSAGMSASGIPDYISNWLSSGGQGVNPADPTAANTPGAGTDALVGTAGPAIVNNIRTWANHHQTGLPGARVPAAPGAAAAPGSITPPAFSPNLQRAAGAVGVTPPGIAPAPGSVSPGATPGAGTSFYDPRFGTAPTIAPQGRFSAPTAQDLEGVTDQQLTQWLRQGGGQNGVNAILGPEQAWLANGKYADPASMRSYAMWRLGMTNGMTAAGAYRPPAAPQDQTGAGYGR